MKWVHLGREKGVSSSHSPVQQPACELVVLRLPCCPALVLSFPIFPLGCALSERGLTGVSGPVL